MTGASAKEKLEDRPEMAGEDGKSRGGTGGGTTVAADLPIWPMGARSNGRLGAPTVVGREDDDHEVWADAKKMRACRRNN
jgi:hypothetical protein